MIKKIGVITFQRANNFGASLQTYALNYYINSLGVRCETIDYKNKKIDNSYKLLRFDFKNPRVFGNLILNFKNNYKKKRKFNKFVESNVVLSKKKYDESSIVKTNSVYDAFITGSDQVWNYNLTNDYNYYLSFVDDNNIKLSYAASFGNGKINKNSDVEDLLKKYHKISVRETSAKEELKKVYGLDVDRVLDPTFLLSREEWDKLTVSPKTNDKYILVYTLHENSAYEISEKLSKLTGLKIYVITRSHKKSIKGTCIRDGGPIDFISLIKNSEYVITDSFHGTVFSIIFRKNLKVVLKRKEIELNDRLTSILHTFELDDCIVDTSSDDTKLISKTDYTQSEKIISETIIESKEFIKSIIDGK